MMRYTATHREDTHMTKTYTVFGTSIKGGQRKVRRANDLEARTKRLLATGHSEITLVDFCAEMTMLEGVTALEGHADFQDEANQLVINDWFIRNGHRTAPAAEVAEEVDSESDEDTDAAIDGEVAEVEDPVTVDELSDDDRLLLTDEELIAMSPKDLGDEAKRRRTNAMKRARRTPVAA